MLTACGDISEGVNEYHHGECQCIAGASISADSEVSPLRNLSLKNIAYTKPTMAATAAATPDIKNAMMVSPAEDLIVLTFWFLTEHGARITGKGETD